MVFESMDMGVDLFLGDISDLYCCYLLLYLYKEKIKNTNQNFFLNQKTG